MIQWKFQVTKVSVKLSPSVISAILKFNELLSRDEKRQCIWIILFAFLVSSLEVITASIIVVFAQVISDSQAGIQHLKTIGIEYELSHGEMIFWVAICVGITYFLKNLITAFEVYYQNFSIQNMNYNFKMKLLRKYSDSDYSFYLSRNSSFNISVVTGDVEQMFSCGMVSGAGIFSEGIVFVFLVGMVIFLNPWMAILIFGLGIIIVAVVSNWILPQFYVWGQRWQEAGLNSSKNILQFFHAFKEVLLLGKREKFLDAYKFHSLKRSQIQAVQSTTNSLPRIVIEVLFVSLFMTTVAVLSLYSDSPGSVIGVLGGYLYAGFRLMPGLNRILNQLNSFKATIPSIERVYSEFNSHFFKASYLNIENLLFNESISLENVSYTYPGTNRLILKSVSFRLKKGEHLGVVGETGSGKSSLIDLLLGLLKPTEGKILIDGRYPVNTFQWHQMIGYVPQTIYLTDDTIEKNIAFGDDEKEINATRLDQVIEDCQLSNLISLLPHGKKTVVGERGVRLSGGERQRIGIARALYRDPQVLIFDEATSALDSSTEAKLIETIKEVSKHRTVIMIAHRVSTLRDCDRILQLKDGRAETVSIRGLIE